jgi:hypothetical protein
MLRGRQYLSSIIHLVKPDILRGSISRKSVYNKLHLEVENAHECICCVTLADRSMAKFDAENAQIRFKINLEAVAWSETFDVKFS